MRDRLGRVPVDRYRDRYPALKTLDAYYGPPDGPAIDGDAFKGVPPENNRITRNVCFGKWLDVTWHADPAMFEVRDNYVTTDDSRIGGPADDFALPADSPAWRLGFQPIPFDLIGLRSDADRERLTRVR